MRRVSARQICKRLSMLPERKPAQKRVTAGRSDATARIRTILTCEEAEGRMSQAMVLALETDMAAADAARVLAASPKASPQPQSPTAQHKKPSWALKPPLIIATAPSAVWRGGPKPLPRPMRALAE